jgi:3-oxoacyl-[acyl-carrier-protein] synthase II
MEAPIAILSPAACTGEYPSLERLFDAWLTIPKGISTTPQHMDESALWNRLVNSAVSETLRQKTDSASSGSCGFILATTKGDFGALEKWIDNADQTPPKTSPPLLSDSASAIAEHFGIAGPYFCVSTACTSGLVGLIEAAAMVQAGEAPSMLVCGADIAGGMVHDGFAALHAISPTACRPFDADRDGLKLGSAAAACLVCRADAALVKNESPVLLLEGWGISSDAVHMTAPDRQAVGLKSAIRQALAMADIRPEQVDAVVLHGTGTPFNDAMEALAVRELFSHRPHLTAVKGLIGHTLGASGLIETALAGLMLEHQVVPPITGLKKPAFEDLALVRDVPVERPIKRVLKTSSGFGGMNAAVVLRLANSI